MLQDRIRAVGIENEEIKSYQQFATVSVSAMAVHGIMITFFDSIMRRRFNGLTMNLPDGMPVKWALKLLHKVGVPSNIRGSDLTFNIVEQAAKDKLPVFFFGSTTECLNQFIKKFKDVFPGLIVAGSRPSEFRT
jgi:UDP-N-acetyl-D-mannosaminuronic acid transferase (WecB/TagA/CpsF family)